MRSRLFASSCALPVLVVGAWLSQVRVAAADQPLEFRLTFAKEVLPTPFTGRVSDIDPMVTRALLVSAGVDAPEVRRVALKALTALVENPEVRAALQNVLDDEPALAAELGISEALDRGNR